MRIVNEILRFGSRDLLRTLIEDALSEPGKERCGLLLGQKVEPNSPTSRPGLVIEIVPAANIADNPGEAYELDP